MEIDEAAADDALSERFDDREVARALADEAALDEITRLRVQAEVLSEEIEGLRRDRANRRRYEPVRLVAGRGAKAIRNEAARNPTAIMLGALGLGFALGAILRDR